jgi:hypothetical protein
VISPSTDREGYVDIGAGGGRRGLSGDPRMVRDEVDDEPEPCLSGGWPTSLTGSSEARRVGLGLIEGDPIGVSSGEKRSAAQRKLDDSTVLRTSQ